MPEPQNQQQPTGGTPSPPPSGGNPPNPPPANPPPKADTPPGTPPAGGKPNPPANGRTGSLYEDLGVETPGVKGAASWPDTWRLDMAGDEKQAKLLERYQSPADVGKALLAAQQRLRSGEYKRAAPPEGAEEEAIAAWREEQGLPVKAEEYTFEHDGKPVDLGALDADTKEVLGQFQKAFFENNVTKQQATVFNKLLVDIGTRQAEAQAKVDATNFDNNDDALRSKWGSDFKTNLSANWNYMSQQFGEANAEAIISARLPDGTRLSDATWFNEAINAMARGANGDTLFAGTTEAKGVESRIAEIETIMRTDQNKYWGDKKMQEEYGQLLAKRPQK